MSVKVAVSLEDNTTISQVQTARLNKASADDVAPE